MFAKLCHKKICQYAWTILGQPASLCHERDSERFIPCEISQQVIPRLSWSVSRLGFSLGIPQVFVVICFSLPMLLTAIASYRWGRWTCLCFTYGACSVQQCTNTFAATVLYAGCLVCSCTFKKGWLPFSPPAPIYPLKCMCLHCGDTHCLVLGPQILQGALARLCGSRMRLQMRAD